MISRRGFISGFAAVVGGIAIDAAIPTGKIFSFPKVIKPLNLYGESRLQDASRLIETGIQRMKFQSDYYSFHWPVVTSSQIAMIREGRAVLVRSN